MDKPNVLEALQKGDMSLQGQFLQGSNYTFLAQIDCGDQQFPVVYKPTRGEQPLWDFPTGTLAKREVVAFKISEALGWDLVPPTVYRRLGPLGAGSVQLYIEHDATYHYFNFEADDKQRLRPVILFDCLVNNADRKASHVLVDASGHIWLIDHGLCFHTEDKLRTVIWDYAGEPIPQPLREDVKRFMLHLRAGGDVAQDLVHLLKEDEVLAMGGRASRLLDSGCFPMPPTDRRVYPWPPV
ncbi:MAG TPA: SCO1664 family protein [Anaerolineaceae bacterium]